MYRFHTFALCLIVALFSGCASTHESSYQTGDYLLVAIGEESQQVNTVVTMSLLESELYIAGPKSIWNAPIRKNKVGDLTKVKELAPEASNSFAILFLQTLEGATLQSTENGDLWMIKNNLTVAVFQPVPANIQTTPLGQ
jgi:hypothetical protein